MPTIKEILAIIILGVICSYTLITIHNNSLERINVLIEKSN